MYMTSGVVFLTVNGLGSRWFATSVAGNRPGM